LEGAVSRLNWFEQLVFVNPFSRLVIGSAVAMLAAQMMINHGGLHSVRGFETMVAGLVVWSAGLTLTLRPVLEQWKKLREAVLG
jgi:hypothetical protein